jgi:cytochrome b involved in lipid metabolism
MCIRDSCSHSLHNTSMLENENIVSTSVYGLIGIVFFICFYYIMGCKMSQPTKGSIVVKKKIKPTGPFSLDEIAKHNKASDCWIIVDKEVYDVTEYIDDHPGGESILKYAGRNSTAAVKGQQHPPSVFDLLALYRIGEVKE